MSEAGRAVDPCCARMRLARLAAARHAARHMARAELLRRRPHTASTCFLPRPRHIPPPSGSPGAPLRALLFDAHHDDYRGVVTLVAVVDGRLAVGDRLVSVASGQEYDALEVRARWSGGVNRCIVILGAW